VLAVSFLWLAVALTVVTGVQYFAEARKPEATGGPAGPATGAAPA
jgi:hypothetical protein